MDNKVDKGKEISQLRDRMLLPAPRKLLVRRGGLVKLRSLAPCLGVEARSRGTLISRVICDHIMTKGPSSVNGLDARKALPGNTIAKGTSSYILTFGRIPAKDAVGRLHAWMRLIVICDQKEELNVPNTSSLSLKNSSTRCLELS